MGWKAGFSPEIDFNNDCSFLRVVSFDVWQGVFMGVRLDIKILIRTSVCALYCTYSTVCSIVLIEVHIIKC